MKTTNYYSVLFLLISFCFFVFDGNAQKPELTRNTGHSDVISSVSFSPDGRFALSGSQDNTIKLWDLETGIEMRTFFGHTFVVNSVCFSPDGKNILSGSWDETAAIWDVSTGKQLKKFVGHSSHVWTAAYSPDGRFIATGSMDHTVKLWDAQTGEVIRTMSGHTSIVRSVRFSPDGKYLLSCSDDKTIILWDTSNGIAIRTFAGHEGEVNAIAFSPDGKLIISGSKDRTLKLWDVETGNVIRTITGHMEDVQLPESQKNKGFKRSIFVGPTDTKSICFSHDGKYILAAATSQVILVDISTGDVIKTLKGHKKAVNSVCFSPDDRFALSCSDDKSIILWDIATGEKVRVIKGRNDQIFSAQITPDEKQIVTSSTDSTIKVWDIHSSSGIKVLKDDDCYIMSLSISPDSKLILSKPNANYFKLWDLSTGKLLRKYQSDDNWVESACFSPDGSSILSGHLKVMEYRLWSVGTGTLIKTYYENGNVYAIGSAIYSPDGSYILYFTSDLENNIKVVDASSRNIVSNYSSGININSISFSPNGNYFAIGGLYGDIQLWNFNNGIQIFNKKGHTNCVRTVSFSPDGKYLITASEDCSIKIWDAYSGSEVKTLTGHVESVNCANYSKSGKYILSASSDGTTKIWDASNWQEIATLVGLSDGNWIVTTPDGRFDASEGGMKRLAFVKVMELIPLDNLFEQYYTPKLLSRVLEGEQIEKPTVDFTNLLPVPKVKIVSPTKDNLVQGVDILGASLKSINQTLEITVQVTDQGGGIDEILLYHNDKLVESTQRGFKSIQQLNDIKTKTFTITLTNGENRFKATAFNNQRTESKSDEIVIIFTANQVEKPDLYLFVIGINEYKNNKYNLNYAFPDAEAFKEVVEKRSRTIFNQVKTVFISNMDVTKDRILKELNTIKANSRSEDVFIFYYAGHGVMSEEEKTQFYIIPNDVTQLYGNNLLLQQKAISAKELQQFSKEIKAQKQLFIIDACQSGGLVDIVASRGAAEEKAIAQLARSTGTFWLAATGTEQFASEFKELKHGLFTYCILKGLDGEADLQNGDKKITVGELSSFLNDIVPELSAKYKGSPQYPNSYGYGQDFPIVISK